MEQEGAPRRRAEARTAPWADGGEPDDLPRVDKAKPAKTPRDVFAYVIHEGKVRAPHAAMAFQKLCA